jgi:Trm5-related predicted tRNA methylase
LSVSTVTSLVAAPTMSVKVAERVMPPPDPWMVIRVDEVGAVVDAERATLEKQVGVQLGMLRVPLTPAGKGVVRLKATGDETPDVRVAVAVSSWA